MKHKHAVEIIAWAGGEEIQYYDAIMCRWADDKNPKWDEETKFRVKPKPKPDAVEYFHATIYSVSPAVHFNRIPNLKLTFDVETCELKAAQVLK
jgi:hypothetical protein